MKEVNKDSKGIKPFQISCIVDLFEQLQQKNLLQWQDIFTLTSETLFACVLTAAQQRLLEMWTP